MTASSKIILKVLRKAYTKAVAGKIKPALTDEFATYKGQRASDLIKEVLLKNDPAMIARFGSNELNCVTNYYNIKHHSKKYGSYIKGDVGAFWWDTNMMKEMSIGAGFFPATTHALEKFARLMIADMKEVDVLGSWLQQEAVFEKELTKARRIRLEDIEPYYHDDPWSLALEGKRVLVIHPFEKSIQEQYLKKDLLFPKKVLPQFDLKTLKAVQTAANNHAGFDNWFDALSYMKEQIERIDFDIAIIGCGAYGFPLAAHVKRLGKKAVHMGGATQILFGIRGKRWEERSPFIASMMNEHWIRPSSNERITDLKKIEEGCYW
jgi:hypothetical protein